MYNIIFIGMIISGLSGFFISLILMVAWRVPDLMDEISGRKAKRQIKHLREANIGTGAFDSMSTNDIYEVMGSGSLIQSSVEKDIETGVIEVVKTSRREGLEEEGIKEKSVNQKDWEEEKEKKEKVEEKEEEEVDEVEEELATGIIEESLILIEEASSIF